MKSPSLVSFVLAAAVAVGFGPGPVDHAKAGRPVVVAQTRTWSGKVTRVKDGDSLMVGNREIRLAAIDAPEYSQPYGREVRQVLHDLVHGRQVRVETVTTDRHGRSVAHVTRDDGLHVNAAMVEAGAAHVYRRYSDDPELLALEDAAKRSGKGLWGLPQSQPVTPETWRREHETLGTAFDCAVRKTRCKQMESCEEARFYLSECGAHWLDGNKDDMPCASLCRR